MEIPSFSVLAARPILPSGPARSRPPSSSFLGRSQSPAAAAAFSFAVADGPGPRVSRLLPTPARCRTGHRPSADPHVGVRATPCPYKGLMPASVTPFATLSKPPPSLTHTRSQQATTLAAIAVLRRRAQFVSAVAPSSSLAFPRTLCWSREDAELVLFLFHALRRPTYVAKLCRLPPSTSVSHTLASGSLGLHLLAR